MESPFFATLSRRGEIIFINLNSALWYQLKEQLRIDTVKWYLGDKLLRLRGRINLFNFSLGKQRQLLPHTISDFDFIRFDNDWMRFYILGILPLTELF